MGGRGVELRTLILTPFFFFLKIHPGKLSFSVTPICHWQSGKARWRMSVLGPGVRSCQDAQGWAVHLGASPELSLQVAVGKGHSAHHRGLPGLSVPPSSATSFVGTSGASMSSRHTLLVPVCGRKRGCLNLPLSGCFLSAASLLSL